jgi:predicted regulator of Ras-like GTPase activity (Roadblock/LC7/MglB family)
VASPPPAALDLEGATDTLLLDAQGLRLAGDLVPPGGRPAGDQVAAELAGVTRECARTARLLALGEWQHLSAESPDGTLLLVAPTPSTALFLTREASVPIGRLALLAEQASRAARAWLERMA